MTRIIPHPPNFTALGAIALFGGAFIYDKKHRITFVIRYELKPMYPYVIR